MSIDLNKLNSMLDKALDKETPESLNEWIDKMENKITQKDIENIKYFSEQYQKSIEETTQPLFTLTSEEVETVQYGLEEAISAYKEYMRKWEGRRDLSEYKLYIHQSIKLLTRINQWQDEQDKT